MLASLIFSLCTHLMGFKPHISTMGGEIGRLRVTALDLKNKNENILSKYLKLIFLNLNSLIILIQSDILMDSVFWDFYDIVNIGEVYIKLGGLDLPQFLDFTYLHVPAVLLPSTHRDMYAYITS